MSKEWEALAAELARLRREKAALVAVLEELALTDGSYENVKNAEVLAARVRGVAARALENVK